MRGLAPGAAVDLLGVEIGKVRSLALQYDAQRKRFPVEVVAEIYPLRLGPVRNALLRDASGGDDTVVIQQLVANGLRAQLRTGNLLTGQLYVALDFVPGPPRTATIAADGAVRMPTVPGTLSELQPQIAEIVHKISKVPFDEIGRDLRTTLAEARAARSASSRPTRRRRSPKCSDAGAGRRRRSTASIATSSIRTRPCSATSRTPCRSCSARRARCASLSDYLQQHPESLLRGKPADPPVPPR